MYLRYWCQVWHSFVDCHGFSTPNTITSSHCWERHT